MEIIFSLAILIMSIVIHEISHGYAAGLLGDPTAKYQGRLTLNPIKHMDPVGSVLVPLVTSLAGVTFGWAKPVPYNPYNFKNQRWGELIVAIAGPLSNILIALVFGFILRFGLSTFPESFLRFSILVILVNLGLAIFNLIPIPPLDGSKVLYAFMPFRFYRFREILERYAFIVLLILIITPGFTSFISVIVARLFGIITGIPLGM